MSDLEEAALSEYDVGSGARRCGTVALANVSEHGRDLELGAWGRRKRKDYSNGETREHNRE
jgi:hypothetical protein